MSNLTYFNPGDGLELVIDTSTGEAFATQSGYARMSGVSRQAINKRVLSSNQTDIKNAEVLTASGLQGCNLIPANIVFEWLLKDNIDLAKRMGEAGATVYLHQLAGYKVSVQPVQQPQLLPAEVRVVNYINTLERLGCDISNPRFNQVLQDFALNAVLGSSLTTKDIQPVYLGVVERAEELGYPIALVTKFRSSLGKFVKMFDLEHTQEKRLCNGTMRDINLYQVTEELDNAIKEFMDAKVLAS